MLKKLLDFILDMGCAMQSICPDEYIMLTCTPENWVSMAWSFYGGVV